MKEIFELCDKNHIKIVISNPNFELWLLMHFPNIEQYDRSMLLKNQKNRQKPLFEDASDNKKYLEILLSRHGGGYKKGSKLPFEKYLPLVDQAVRQAKLFCEDSKQLIDELGTSMGKLIDEMRV